MNIKRSFAENNEMKEQLKNNYGTYHVTRFLNELNIKILLPTIDK